MDKRKHEQHTAIRERAARALGDLYHNATPRYPSLDDDESARFDSWFPDTASFEVEYLRDGGAYGKNYRRTLADNAANKPWSERARAYSIKRGMRQMHLEREDCGTLTGWRVLELAAGNNALRRKLAKVYGKAPFKRNNAMWEYITDYGELYQYGRGGRTLAPDGLIRQRGGSSFSIREDYADDLPIAGVVRLVQVVESFNRYVSTWCDSVPDQWREYREEEKAQERAERAELARRKREMRKKRAAVKPCECGDPGCPVHKGEACGNAAKQKVRRIDMDDGETTFDMCDECAADALDSGVFAIDDR